MKASETQNPRDHKPICRSGFSNAPTRGTNRAGRYCGRTCARGANIPVCSTRRAKSAMVFSLTIDSSASEPRDAAPVSKVRKRVGMPHTKRGRAISGTDPLFQSVAETGSTRLELSWSFNAGFGCWLPGAGFARQHGPYSSRCSAYAVVRLTTERIVHPSRGQQVRLAAPFVFQSLISPRAAAARSPARGGNASPARTNRPATAVLPRSMACRGCPCRRGRQAGRSWSARRTRPGP